MSPNRGIPTSTTDRAKTLEEEDWYVFIPLSLTGYLSNPLSMCLSAYPSISISLYLFIDGRYHGLLPREDINRMLRSQGDWIVRKTEVQCIKNDY